MVKGLLKFWIFWIFGVFVASFAMSLWQREDLDWEHVANMSIGGLIGVLIVQEQGRL